MFSVVFVCLSVPRILQEICLEPMDNRLYFRDDPDYDTDPVSGLR